ncbi:MAG: YbdD/YjiX family protein [Propionibacteriaceae bacterium]|nr:YbdD/YjiX family protein [Propionibacteriaceae bacterium]
MTGTTVANHSTPIPSPSATGSQDDRRHLWYCLKRTGQVISWYVKAVLGESDYDRYVAHLRAHHPDQPVPTVKQYWRERYAAEDRQPTSRCC